MYKILCLFAIVAAVVGMPHAPKWHAPEPLPTGRIVKRNAQQTSLQEQTQGVNDIGGAADATSKDDMEKAETFGFGYHRYYAYPRFYYPSYYYAYSYPYHSYYW